MTLPRARDPESETHGKVGVAGGVAEGGRRLSLEFGTRDSSEFPLPMYSIHT